MHKQHNKHDPPVCKTRNVVLSCKWAILKAIQDLAESVRIVVFGTFGSTPGKEGAWAEFCAYKGRSKLSKLLTVRLLRAKNHILLSLIPLATIPLLMPKMSLKME